MDDRTLTSDLTPHSAKRALKLVLPLAALLAGVMALAVSADTEIPNYLPFHTASEIFAVVVAGMIFAVAWNTRAIDSVGPVAILASAFLAVGLLDLGHLLSFPGMPEFVTPNSTEKGIQFWLCARMVAAGGLFAAVVVKPSWRFGSHGLLVGIALIFTAVVFASILTGNPLLPVMFVEGVGLTTEKIIAEYLIIGVNIVTALIIIWRWRRPQVFNPVHILAAVVTMGFSELSFTFYLSPYDLTNGLGHAYKFISYVFIYRAVFVVRVREPYRRLELAAEQLRAEGERVRTAEGDRERLVGALEAATDFVGIFDLSGRFLYLNAAGRFMAGLAPHDEISDLKLTDLYPDDSVGSIMRDALPTVLSGIAWTGRPAFRSMAGETLAVSQVIVPHRGAGGRIDYLSTIIRDETEREQLQAQLLQSQKMETVGRLAGGIAHDFNNLLTIILFSAGILRTSLEQSDPLRSEVDFIEDAAERASALTRQLLTFAKRQPIEPHVFDVPAALTNLTKLLRRLLGEQIELELVTCCDDLSLYMDPGQFEQLVVNLAVNARDAMPDGGRLVIRTACTQKEGARPLGLEQSEYAILTVSDDGIGMPEEVRRHVFEPFFTTKGPDRGTGLGLATCYGIVTRCNGAITCVSSPGSGTTMTVWLPRAPAGSHDRPFTERGERSMRKATILLVEDEALVRALVRQLLDDLGHTVIEAASAQQAVEALASRTESIDVLLSDVGLPDVDGTTLARQVHTLYPEMKIVLMSGYGEQRETLDPSELPHSFLPKPFAPAALVAKLGEVLAVVS